MKLLKTAALGILLASAAWMPGLANGLDEAAQVTSDPFVAYTLYQDMPITEAVQTFDALPDWTKKMEYKRGIYTNVPAPLVYTYTRTLADKTKQVLSFSKYEGQEVIGGFNLIFYTKKTKDAEQMFQQAYKSIDSYQKWYKTGDPNSKRTDICATFWDNDGYTISLELNRDKNMFAVYRYLVDMR